MSSSTTPLSADLEQAFTVLSDYKPGSCRASLMPIDRAVAASYKDSRLREQLESRLVASIRAWHSDAAAEYICSRLAIVGSKEAVPVLASLLANPHVAASARTALGLIPSNGATKALRGSLEKLDGSLKAGVVTSLGARRDAGSTRALAGLLEGEDAQVAEASAAALGEIGTTRAAKALRARLSSAPEPLRAKVVDALLACAEQLASKGNASAARGLYSFLRESQLPKHIQAADARGLTS